MRAIARTTTVIDLGSAAVHAAEITPGGAPTTAAIERAETGTALDHAEAAAIVRALRRRGLRCEHAHLIAPKRAVQALPVDLPPPQSDAPVVEIAACRVADMLEAERGTFETAITTRAPGGGTRRSSTVAACRHAESVGIIDAFEAAGVGVESLLAPASALIAAGELALRSETPNDTDTETTTGTGARVLLDVGWRDATAVAIDGGQPVFERHLRKLGFGRVADELEAQVCGDRALSEWIARRGHRNEITLAERAVGAIRPFGIDLVRELEATIVYFEELAGPGAVTGVLVAGGGAEDPELMDWLDANIWLPTRRLADSLPGSPPPASAVAAGLAAAIAGGHRKARGASR